MNVAVAVAKILFCKYVAPFIVRQLVERFMPQICKVVTSVVFKLLPRMANKFAAYAFQQLAH